MAGLTWREERRMLCPHPGVIARLLVQVISPNEILADGTGDHVHARRCSLDLECNQAGYPCRWAFTNPDLDPFQLA
jgi:hypothetical protein